MREIAQGSYADNLETWGKQADRLVPHTQCNWYVPGESRVELL